MSDFYGASQADWDHLTLVLGLGEHLLPVVSNPNAKISPASSLKRLGQIPSLYNSEHLVSGFAKWTEHKTTGAETDRWSKERDYGICIQARAVRALDCDILDDALARRVFNRIFALHPSSPAFPVRGRSNAPKFLIPFRLDGLYPKRVLKLKGGTPDCKIEFLANGQQFIAVGTHPSGVRYEWKGGLPYNIPTFSPEQFESIWSMLEQEFGAEKSAIESSSMRKEAGGEIDDDRLTFLEKAGVVAGWSPEGAPYITCPFKSGHSKDGDITETIYFPAGLRGYAQGHFKCLHASCAGRTDDDFFEAMGYTSEMFDVLPEAPPEVRPLKYTFLPALAYSNLPPPEYIIEDVLPLADLAVIYGAPGSGKSFIALDMLFAVARGLDWNGKKVKQGRVAYVAAEDTIGVRSRLKAYAKFHNISDEELNSLPFTILAAQPNLMDLPDTREVARGINAQGPTLLVVFDTFARIAQGANENAAEDMNLAIHHCGNIKESTGAMVGLVHHAGKDASKGARGSNALLGAADVEYAITREGNARNMRVTKMKNGPDGGEWGLNLIPVEVGKNASGAPITSAVLEYTEKQRVIPKGRPPGGMEKICLDTFENMGGTPIAWNSFLEETKRYVPKPEGKDNRSTRIKRALESLHLKGLLSFKDDRVSAPLAFNED